jgi:hypothetical protein
MTEEHRTQNAVATAYAQLHALADHLAPAVSLEAAVRDYLESLVLASDEAISPSLENLIRAYAMARIGQ